MRGGGGDQRDRKDSSDGCDRDRGVGVGEANVTLAHQGIPSKTAGAVGRRGLLLLPMTSSDCSESGRDAGSNDPTPIGRGESSCRRESPSTVVGGTGNWVGSEKEHEADADLAAGRTTGYESDEKFLARARCSLARSTQSGLDIGPR